ncbi:Gfo/Idh/MocA family oxidoreductase [Shimia sp. R9_1]|uniref:Gfo/Idh/MocA family protein n=1 Tax=Shimia sp. R9_1 TaxID=2821111 RepID=UPI001AD9AE10|nr:Gfo/Idh/MocA family oxidoreductase [Shimia sp. R9_1]MBO9409731.1 Gfo/Idh/MocA family oxidoreductase [Shimia sp. R9_1]
MMKSDFAEKIGIAFVGCGYVADLYQATLSNWTGLLDLRGVHDISLARQTQFASHYGVRQYDSLDAILTDPNVQIVVNLTPPAQHYAISQKCLSAGRHVYSEKPLALNLAEAKHLVDLAQEKGVHVVSAPSSFLGPAGQTLYQAVRNREQGVPRLVYAEMDDGMVHRIGYENWKTASGAYWPAENEFETGCTLEHAGYALTWLVGMFGPVRRMVSFASCLVADKGPDTPTNYTTPDFTAACLEFDDGLVARLTNSIVAPHDHQFRIMCDDGVLSVDETWDFSSPVRSTPLPTTRLQRGAKKLLGLDFGKRLQPEASREISTAKRGYPMDFALGVAEMAMALKSGTPPRLGGEFSLHITEVSLAIQHPEIFGAEYNPTSAPEKMEPMKVLEPS